MKTKKVVKALLWTINIFLIFLLIWSWINYQTLNQEISNLVKAWGLIAMIFFIIILEGAPVFVGPSIAVASALTIGIYKPEFIFLVFILSALVGNILYYSLGYFSGEKILQYFGKRYVHHYKDFFRSYGTRTLVIMAISPIPYLPTFAGVFRLKSPKTILKILFLRMTRHTVVFFFWFFTIKTFS